MIHSGRKLRRSRDCRGTPRRDSIAGNPRFRSGLDKIAVRDYSAAPDGREARDVVEEAALRAGAPGHTTSRLRAVKP
ncbi:hypothetical protein P3102_14940 [Amycolatopsis sp. QT-25]|uniref:hypothetical protein n=1 Tax=Amycolatopsis sp. QT-25 TaxID=3034022 RepID=UPI0023EC4F9E|nr:hypothetical protein [Amycolatopsis sp. QT-25]WET82405.1 hypothetical protein P3102_14940 [Amycolatopsis sp. QT-25]